MGAGLGVRGSRLRAHADTAAPRTGWRLRQSRRAGEAEAGAEIGVGFSAIPEVCVKVLLPGAGPLSYQSPHGLSHKAGVLHQPR